VCLLLAKAGRVVRSSAAVGTQGWMLFLVYVSVGGEVSVAAANATRHANLHLSVYLSVCVSASIS